ncbi:MAG: hypothetical protein MUC36_25565 [Planctomycetes bacterium]|jgi:hypothetical protein|nr:hypothetical protein [Planctomycetota bacterium]
MHHSFRLSLLALLGLSTGLVAQTVTLRGRVTDGSAAGCYYCTGFAHVFKYTGTRLQSSTINLNPFMNQDITVTGTWNGTYVNVTSAQLVPESFSLSGSGTIGESFDLNTNGTPGNLAINLVAFGAGLVIPFADLGLQLNPASAVVHGYGLIDGGGEFTSELSVPNVPSLIGLRVFGQGVVLPASGTFYSTNPDAKEVG